LEVELSVKGLRMGLDWWLDFTVAVNDDECCPEKLVPGISALGDVSREDRVKSLHDCRVAEVSGMLQTVINLREAARAASSKVLMGKEQKLHLY
jgi:hypothetical protein